MNNHKLNNQKVIVCKHCGYDANPAKAKHCLECGKPLEFTKPKLKSLGDLLFTPWVIRLGAGLLFVLVSWSIYSLFKSVSDLNNFDSIGVPNSSSSNQNIPSDVKLYNSIKDVPNVPEGTFNYGGGNVFAALTAQGFHEAIAKAHPNFRLRFTEPKDGKPGGKKGIAMLLDGKLSFAIYGASLEDTDYSKAQQRGFGLKQVPISIDALVFFTHPEITIPGLSVNQLQDIYKGKLTNWKQVGGPDLPIVPFARDPKASKSLNEVLGLEADQYSSRVQFVRDTTESIRKVVSTPGGISFGVYALIAGQRTIRPLAIAKANSQEYVQPVIDDGKRINIDAIRDSSYPLSRRVFIVYRKDGTIDQLAGEAYTNMLLSKEGQQFVEKAGFIPVR
ncbi:PstS family phosphate ABC transporter substrate-binding protein [Fischerella sp. PCC 9605]|uniref:PstS family phosphate ABC transporter substrate-binding protein n=1 Tax=Fischerella sp. PCC 9605 TaxID=1173024 RepID=UPI00047D5D80|nr:substrate-binding domain-containing protein [Fischerella sp. PCC 9605]